MDEKEKKELIADFKSVVDDAIEGNIEEIAGKAVSKKVKSIVNSMRLERAMFGKDKSGLSEETRMAIGEDIKAIFTGTGEKTVLVSSDDSAGGYLVPEEVHAGIFRIAETVGLVTRDAKRFSLSTESLDVPIYTGAALLGSYAGEDQATDEQDVPIGDAKLATKEWSVIFRMSNKLLKNSAINLSDWLIALAAEGMAARFDKEGFTGGTFAGSPFIGILGSDDVTVFTQTSGLVDFEDFTADVASDVIGSMPTSSLGQAGFYFHRTVWAKIRVSKDADGNYLFDQSGFNLGTFKKENGIQAVGTILGYPVYTSDYLPANSASAVSTKFGIFANLNESLYIGDAGPMEIAKSDSAVVGGNSTFEKRQMAIRIAHEHAIVIGLPGAAIAIRTAAS